MARLCSLCSTISTAVKKVNILFCKIKCADKKVCLTVTEKKIKVVFSSDRKHAFLRGLNTMKKLIVAGAILAAAGSASADTWFGDCKPVVGVDFKWSRIK